MFSKIPEINERIIRFEESAENGKTILWMGTALQGAIRLTVSDNNDYKVDKYGSDDGLIENSWVYPFKLDNKIVSFHSAMAYCHLLMTKQ